MLGRLLGECCCMSFPKFLEVQLVVALQENQLLAHLLVLPLGPSRMLTIMPQFRRLGISNEVLDVAVSVSSMLTQARDLPLEGLDFGQRYMAEIVLSVMPWRVQLAHQRRAPRDAAGRGAGAQGVVEKVDVGAARQGR